MTSTAPDPLPDDLRTKALDAVADELRQESEKLRQLAEQVKARQEVLAEIETNYPYFRQFVYARVREEFERTLPELSDKDLESIARDEQAQPLEAFIGDLERLQERP